MSRPLANYQVEQAQILRLYEDDPAERIMLVRGASGSGKTELVRHCLSQRGTQTVQIPVQLRQEAGSVAEVLFRTGSKLGWRNFEQFRTQVAALQKVPTINIANNRMLGKNEIAVALQASSMEDKINRRTLLTSAWFEDIAATGRRLLFAFDTYEDAGPEMRTWLCGAFLARVADLPQIRVLIAGQEVPDAHNIEWGPCCAEPCELTGVHDPRHWLPVMEKLGKVVPTGDPLEMLAWICRRYKGDPKPIADMIRSFPNGGVTP